MSSLRDNYKRGSVGDFLKEKIKTEAKLSFVSAFFTIYAYEKIKDSLESAKELRFLFGDPGFVSNLDPAKDEAKAFVIESLQINLSNRLQQKAVARDCAEWIKNKVQIRSVREKGFLHGKLYHIDNNGVKEAILGSSNFTVKGLGLSDRPNIELNLEVLDRRDTDELKSWFDEIWEHPTLVEDVKEQVLTYLSQLYTDNVPDFIYYKTLYHVFEKFISEDDPKNLLNEKTKVLDTKIWSALYKFQRDGARGAINKILRHNGCILADSVGLGKTFTALAVIKYFELLNYRILVLCPKRLRDNWTVYQASTNSELNPFLEDKFGYTVLSHTDLSREDGKVGDINLRDFKWENFDLVVIDESHNFRNNTKGKKDEEGKTIKKSRYERLIDDIITKGVKTRILLLSATPVNNHLKDLRNQINFISGNDVNAFSESLSIKDYSETLRVAQTQFSLWAKGDDRNVKQLLERLDSALFKLLDELTIARSRKHITKYYNIAEIGHFPKREKPKSIYPAIDSLGKFMAYDQLNDEMIKYKLSLYNPSYYIKPEFKSIYDGKLTDFRQEDREHFLIGMMKVNFMKRLESSIHSFEISMNRTVGKITELQNKINEYKKSLISQEIDTDDVKIIDPDDEELEDAFEVGKKISFKLEHLDIDKWTTDLTRDKDQLTKLRDLAHEVDAKRDAKLGELKSLISSKINNPFENLNGKKVKKVLVFTAFADTAVYLFDQLKDWAQKEHKVNIALVTGGSSEIRTTFGKNEFSNILMNFAPIAKERSKLKGMPQDGEIDILIATDCISEGQNLQDCDFLVNYDIHWNPVRIIQRFGRIDRLGSRNKTIQMVNFWPTKELDKYIKLKSRVEAKMALVDLTATAEENILNEDEIRDLIDGDLKYRDKQLIRLKDEVLDIEDVTDGVSLGEFSLDDFRRDLLNYIAANKDILRDAPLGMNAIVPSQDDLLTKLPSGVIFCLKHKKDSDKPDGINPIPPYFLVYVQDDNEIRYTFVHVKQILEIYRILCAGKKEAYKELCRLFDAETKQGRNIEKYNSLLDRAVKSTAEIFRKRNFSSLTSSRSGKLISSQNSPNSEDDFELISWLIIK